MNKTTVELRVENSPTVLSRVIEIVKRRRINIFKIVAEQKNENDADIHITMEADQEQIRLVTKQFEKLVDVLEVISE